MFSNLSRQDDHKLVSQYGLPLSSLNQDRIRSVIENKGRYEDDELVRSLDQVVEYDPDMLKLPLGNHFMSYSVQKRARAAVLQRLLELWPANDELTLKQARTMCDRQSLCALKRVLDKYKAGVINSGKDTNDPPELANETSCALPFCNLPADKFCSRCNCVGYCSKEHQKEHWKMHKAVCTNAPRHRVSEFTVEAIQRAINQANEGDVIELPRGTYENTAHKKGLLLVHKPIRFVGAGPNLTRIQTNLQVSSVNNSNKQEMLVFSDIGIDGCVQVEECQYKEIMFLSTEVQCPRKDAGTNAFEVKCDGKITLDYCEITGGSDGLCILGRETQASVKRTNISYCQHRGILANQPFAIGPHCDIYNCGAYGIKGRRGWNEVGSNRIQPGPWQAQGPC